MRMDALEPRIALSAAAMDLIGLSELRAHPFYSQFDGTGQTVVVIDQPIDWTSPFLAERRVTDIDVLGTSGPITGETHGTFVASIVGASNNQIGVAPGAGIIGVLSDGTEPPMGTNPNEVWRLNENDIDHLLDWVLANHEQFNIVAVNMSLGDSRFYTSAGQVAQRPLNDEIAALEAAGVAVVTSAGNDYHENQTRNASYPAVVSTFAVGAVYAANVGPQVSLGDFTTGPDRIAAFSQRAAADEGNVLFAPGAAVRGVQQGSQQGLGSGTSFASPYVAAAVAILQQAALEIVGSRLPVEQIAQLLIDTSDTIIDGDDEDDDVENTGAAFPRINILAAVEALDEMFSEAGLLVRGGGSLDQPIEHDEKARRSSGSGYGPVERDGEVKDHSFLLTNTGTGTLRIDRIEIRGQIPEAYMVLGNTPDELAPGESATIMVRYDPTAYGKQRANVSVFSSAVGRARYTVKLAGSGVAPASAPDIAITGDTETIRAGDRKARPGTGTKLGGVEVGQAVERTFTIRNRGGSVLTLDTMFFFISGVHSLDYQITVRPPVSTLDPTRTTTFAVSFTPSELGKRKADIIVISNDPDETPFVFRVVGVGR